MPFSVHVDPDDLAQKDLAAGLSLPALPGDAAGSRQADGSDVAHHGAGDGRQAARQRSERDRAGRAAGAASSRSYAFRRS